MGFYRYIDYAIKCIIRKILFSDWFWKILFLVIMVFVTMFLCNNIVYGATEIDYSVLSNVVAQDMTYTGVNSFISTDLGFNTYYIRVKQGTKVLVSFTYNVSDVISSIDYRYGISIRQPGVDVYYYSFSRGALTNSYSGSFVYDIPVNSGFPDDGYVYFYLSLKPNNYDINIAFYDETDYSKETVLQLENIDNTIKDSTSQIIDSQEQINDSLTSTEYDDSVVNIDVSSAEDVDDTEVTGLFTTVFENLSNLISSSSWSSVEVIEIGLPYTDGKIELRSDILSNIVGNSLLRTLINVAWYSLFGLYVFRFVTNIYHSIKSGNILNGINFDNEVISSTML